MSITVIDYGSGNLRSAAKALEAAASNTNLDLKIVVTSNPEVIKKSNKVILPGQGSFRDCYLGIKKISGLKDVLNEFVLVKKKPIFGICVGMQLFAKIGYESQETKGFGWLDATVKKINNIKISNIKKNKLNSIKTKKKISGIIPSGTLKSLKFHNNEDVAKYNLIIICAGNDSSLIKKIFKNETFQYSYEETAITSMLKHNSLQNNEMNYHFF